MVSKSLASITACLSDPVAESLVFCTSIVAAFTALNTTSNPIIASITVTPSVPGGCVGPDSTFTITVNPIPLVNSISDLTLCANILTNPINFNSGTIGTTFSWTNNTPSIGLAANGNGDITAFTALNTTSNPITATIAVTPTADGCVGPDITFDITVHPTPMADAVADATYCNTDAGAAINFNSATPGTTYDWAGTTDVGFGTAGTGNIGAYVATNTTAAPITPLNKSPTTPSINDIPK